MARKIGYARVSTAEQNLALQVDALRAAGCDFIIEDKGYSGALTHRPGLGQLMAALEPGDTLVIWKLDRLGRSSRHLLDIVADLQDREIGFQSLQDAINTTNAMGTFVFQVMAAIAELERNQISERTIAGMAAAKKRGAPIGRPRSLSPEKIEAARQRIAAGAATIPQAAKELGVGRTTLWRALRD